MNEPAEKVFDPKNAARDARGRLLPGNQLSRGRKGGRDRLSRKFFEDLHALWEDQGDGILRRAAFEDPVGLVQVIAKLMPQKLEIRDTTLEEMDDDRLLALLNLVERAREHVGGGASSAPKTIEARVVETQVGEPARLLSSLPEAT